MDKKTLYPINSPDVDQVDVPPTYSEVVAGAHTAENPNYRGGGESSSFQPSAPPSVQGDEYAGFNNGQHYYQSIPMPTTASPLPTQSPLERVRYIIRKRDQDERHFPVNASLFLLGCLFPPLWFIGCCWTSKNKYEIAWRKLNICMSILSIIAIFLFFFLFILIAIFGDGEDPDWEFPDYVSNYLPSLF